MKLDPKIIGMLVGRKSITLLSGVAIGAVIVAMNDELLDLVRKSVTLFAGGGGTLVVVSTILSLINDEKKAEAIEDAKQSKIEAAENIYKAPDGFMLVKVKAETAEPLK